MEDSNGGIFKTLYKRKNQHENDYLPLLPKITIYSRMGFAGIIDELLSLAVKINSSKTTK